MGYGQALDNWAWVSTYKFQGSLWYRTEHEMKKEEKGTDYELGVSICIFFQGFTNAGQVWHICFSYCVIYYKIRD